MPDLGISETMRTEHSKEAMAGATAAANVANDTTEVLNRVVQVSPSGVASFFTPYDCLRQFHAAMGTHGNMAKRVDPKMIQRRINIVDEEVNKEMLPLLRALADGTKTASLENVAELLDHCVDVVYVAMGTAMEFGLPFDQAFIIVHQANMAKFAKGLNLREDGKLLKPEGWVPPTEAIQALVREAYAYALKHTKPDAANDLPAHTSEDTLTKKTEDKTPATAIAPENPEQKEKKGETGVE